MNDNDIELETKEIIKKIRQITNGQPRPIVLCAIDVVRSEILQHANEDAIMSGVCDHPAE